MEMADFFNLHELEAITAYYQGTSYQKEYKLSGLIDHKIHGFLSRLLGLQGYFSIFKTVEFIKYLKKTKPDIVHLNNLHESYINIILLMKFLGKYDVPTVITLHDCWFFTGKCCYYVNKNCSKWKNGCGDCPRIDSYVPSWFFDFTRKMLRDKKKLLTGIPRLAVIGVSDWITDEARMSFLAEAKILERIYNWIDLVTFKPIETKDYKNALGLDSYFIILGVASNWSASKGLPEFIELAKVLPDDMKIILVGKMKKTANLPVNIIHIEETHAVEELVRYYSMADVFVNFSKQETFGKVTAEALACGTPVVAYNVTATPELVGENCGYVINCSIEETLKAIHEVKRNGKKSYSSSCRQLALDNFEKEARLNDYMQVYRELNRNNSIEK